MAEEMRFAQKPSLARMVIVSVDPAKNGGSDEAPAVITRVWNDTLVNVKVLNDSPNNEWKTSVTLHAEKPEDHCIHGNSAWWPPRV